MLISFHWGGDVKWRLLCHYLFLLKKWLKVISMLKATASFYYFFLYIDQQYFPDILWAIILSSLNGLFKDFFFRHWLLFTHTQSVTSLFQKNIFLLFKLLFFFMGRSAIYSPLYCVYMTEVAEERILFWFRRRSHQQPVAQTLFQFPLLNGKSHNWTENKILDASKNIFKALI